MVQYSGCFVAVPSSLNPNQRRCGRCTSPTTTSSMMAGTFAIFLLTVGACSAQRNNYYGNAQCPCIIPPDGVVNLDLYRVPQTPSGQLMYAGLEYPTDYGIGCKQHDVDLGPYCLEENANMPEWCWERFCYIDPTDCNLPLKYKSGYFPQSDIYYSFQTCGVNGTFHEWFVNDTLTHDLLELGEVVDNYVLTLRNDLQESYSEVSLVESQCAYDSSCDCDNCESVPAWSAEVDFSTTIVVPNQVTSMLDATSCMFSAARSYFLRVASAEYEKEEYVGTLYGATQADGAFTQWPVRLPSSSCSAANTTRWLVQRCFDSVFCCLFATVCLTE